jgi:hypothetical protein
MKLAILGLSGVLLLSGCASTPVITVEDQTKLIEYDNCVQRRVERSALAYETYEESLEACKTFRP